MGRAPSPDHEPWAVPAAAAAEWLELTESLERAGPVACQTQDPAAWWPDRYEMNGPAAHGALAACRRCPVAAACLAYAVAADERYGIWGGTLPAQRRALRWGSAPEAR